MPDDVFIDGLSLNAICAAVQAASLAGDYELAVKLLRDAKLDRCFVCASECVRQRARVRIWCLGDGRLTAVDRKFVNTNVCDPLLIGWVHRDVCTAQVKRTLPGSRCFHEHAIELAKVTVYVFKTPT